MSSYRPRGGYTGPQQPYRSFHPSQQDDFYDDRSRSRSRERRHSSPRRRSPPHADHQRDRPKENSIFVAVLGVQIEDVTAAMRDATAIMTTIAAHRPPAEADRHTMIETTLAPLHETTAVEVEADTAHRFLGFSKQISSELKQYYHAEGIEDVRVIRDKQTRQSRRFGFLRFGTLQEAEAFMDRNYPIIYLYGDSNKSNGDASKVRITFSRERKDPRRSDGPDWICDTCLINNFATRDRCFRCQAEKPENPTYAATKPPNVGDNDASPDNHPSQFLLLRGLEPSMSEELLVKGVGKLNKPNPSTAQRDETPAKKGAKVASTTGDANLGAKEGTLRRVLLVRDRRTNESWRYGFAEYASIEDAQAALIRYNSFERFTIASKQVLVSYIHAGVFVPVLNPTPDIERFCFSPVGNPAMKLAYWDEGAYVKELAVSMPTTAPQDPKNGSTTRTDAGTKPTKDVERAKKRKALSDVDATGVKKTVPSHLQFWSNRHAELHGITKKSHDREDSRSTDGNESADAPPSQSYADPNRHCCYLCMRQFNNAAEVNKHERLSDLHRSNRQDEVKVKKAQAKLAKHGIQCQFVMAAAQPVQEYRDRAKERRKIYGVVNKKGEQVGQAPRSSRASSDDEAPPPVVQSKGASLLSKMGYTVGQGLGASGEGMTTPISQDVYVAGVGLGAQGGKLGDAIVEAERNTKGDYGGFLEETRQRARERYARME
ncbi:uncharacterized protein Z519_10761 [Cladophialophora bantiana CBS 173.52]|uniref:RNA-binding protein n=1 Tax=Cladophialophora bantiana (strain ATCC 10958 / CBS 173.52 / CDC B-1940 / NIH 8579) TaxID=1442370 RepID=A0A0D2HCT7_CLAB1|nr:uncharacterized protein Z519_10761 [Cladophialophora bantiana CBS 173.52]KIW88715.1 hypothetical protein Z519_10761 [Cladophialophora bantiana CBS 173.52]